MDDRLNDTGMLMIWLHGRLVSVTVCLPFTRIFGLRVMIKCPGKMGHDDSVVSAWLAKIRSGPRQSRHMTGLGFKNLGRWGDA